MCKPILVFSFGLDQAEQQLQEKENIIKKTFMGLIGGGLERKRRNLFELKQVQ